MKIILDFWIGHDKKLISLKTSIEVTDKILKKTATKQSKRMKRKNRNEKHAIYVSEGLKLYFEYYSKVFDITSTDSDLLNNLL